MGQSYSYILVNFAYILIFGILTLAVMTLNMPKKDDSLKNYKIARYTLGGATGLIACYCVFRLLLPQHHGDYEDFWMQVTTTLCFSWLTYSSFLFLIETPRYIIRNFITDGFVPLVLMAISGFVGLIFPSAQKTIMIIFGCIYAAKCIWMLFTCTKEYRKCTREIENYYDEGPDMKWMYVTLLLCFILFIGTLMVFYIESLQLIYYITVPCIYIYLVFKLIGFATKKIDNVRRKNLYLESEPKVERKEKSKDLAEKMAPIVEKWISDKGFCNEGLNIEEVASQMGTNHNYLSQYINNELGTTFQIWLNTLRIEESKILLTSKEKISIEDIGIRVGIPQNYNFSRWFKIVTGTTPLRYRKADLSR